MGWFAPKRGTTVDVPTVNLTAAERAAFSDLAATYDERRRIVRRLLRWCAVSNPRRGTLWWTVGAVWIVLWLTTSPLLSALGVIPYGFGMRAVISAPAATARGRRVLRRVIRGRT